VTPVSQGSAEQAFAERFAQAWAAPTPEGLVELLHEDVRLYQPTFAPIHGRQQALAEFRRLLGNVPGLYGVVDRFLIRDGLALERRVYFDQLSLLLAVIARPGLWGGFMRYRFGG
jgi:hypothetical protein